MDLVDEGFGVTALNPASKAALRLSHSHSIHTSSLPRYFDNHRHTLYKPHSPKYQVPSVQQVIMGGASREGTPLDPLPAFSLDR